MGSQTTLTSAASVYNLLQQQSTESTGTKEHTRPANDQRHRTKNQKSSYELQSIAKYFVSINGEKLCFMMSKHPIFSGLDIFRFDSVFGFFFQLATSWKRTLIYLKLVMFSGVLFVWVNVCLLCVCACAGVPLYHLSKSQHIFHTNESAKRYNSKAFRNNSLSTYEHYELEPHRIRFEFEYGSQIWKRSFYRNICYFKAHSLAAAEVINTVYRNAIPRDLRYFIPFAGSISSFVLWSNNHICRLLVW